MAVTGSLIGPVYCETLDEALREVAKRRVARADGMITKCEPSPYGGYRVYSVDVDVVVDDLVDPLVPNARQHLSRLYR